MRNRTFAMVKPGAVQRGLIGEVIARFEKKGLNIIGMKMLNVSDEQAQKHYQVHLGKDFYPRLIDAIQAGSVVALVIEGANAVDLVRHMAGATLPTEAEMGTIRGDLSADRTDNIIHTSDSIENAELEIAIYFKEEEIMKYKRPTDPFTFTFAEEQ